MAVVTFYTNGKDQTGNTTSAIALATYLGITKNKKTLLLSTSFNDDTVRRAFWPEQAKKRSGLFGPNTNLTSENGIEGLDRIVRSNKISPDIVTDYTKVALKGRLEILLGFNGTEEQYKDIQQRYIQIIVLASKYYDTVIVDIDKNLEIKTKNEILNASDVVIGMINQNMKELDNLINTLSQGVAAKRINTLITIGKYDEKSKYNAKNISRNILKQKEIINTVPYNTIMLDSMQEGTVIDTFLQFLRLKGKDENTFFIEELNRLGESIEHKHLEVQRMGGKNT